MYEWYPGLSKVSNGLGAGCGTEFCIGQEYIANVLSDVGLTWFGGQFVMQHSNAESLTDRNLLPCQVDEGKKEGIWCVVKLSATS